MPNPLRRDPTRTTTLRNQFSADMKRRFRRLKKQTYDLIVQEDALGLSPMVAGPFTTNKRWAFETLETFPPASRDEVNP